MATPGDGAARSEKRRLTAMISLRLGADEKHRFEEAARRSGFPALSAWILDRLRTGGGMRQRRVACGHLGRIGADINELARTGAAKDPDHLRRTLRRIGTDIAALQRRLMEDGDHAGEGDP